MIHTCAIVNVQKSSKLNQTYITSAIIMTENQNIWHNYIQKKPGVLFTQLLLFINNNLKTD